MATRTIICSVLLNRGVIFLQMAKVGTTQMYISYSVGLTLEREGERKRRREGEREKEGGSGREETSGGPTVVLQIIHTLLCYAV